MKPGGAVVVLIEDDPYIRGVVSAGLRPYGYEIRATESAAHGLMLATASETDLVLLDLGLPDNDGIEVLRALRKRSSLPVIVISARTLEPDKVAALDTGADDYLTKPFSLDELHARIRVALRRVARDARAGSDSVFESGELKLDMAHRRVYLRGEPVRLTPIEYSLLVVLAKHGGKVLTHEHLLSMVWGAGHEKNTQYLRIYMGLLRKKLEADPAQPKLLMTESGVGYRLSVDSPT
jgi:two-component system KDP operon response regulator KdpE